MRPATRFERVDLFDIPLDLVSLEELVGWVGEVVEGGLQAEHGSLAANNVIRAGDDPEYVDALRGHSVVTADGQGVVWAARLLGHEVPERVAGADLMLALLHLADTRGYRVYLLGSAPDVLADAEAAITRNYPHLTIAGRHHGFFPPSADTEVVADVAASNADLLFVAMPSPRKEIFLVRHREALSVPFAMGVGGMFDVIAGRVRRAPQWIQRAGFEWAYRMVQEPRRLFWRYATTHTRFIVRAAPVIARQRLATRRVRNAS